MKKQGTKENKALVPTEQSLAKVEEFSSDVALARIDERIKFIEGLRQRLKKGEDYNTHKGYSKPSLEQPGAEKILSCLNCGYDVERGEQGVVWNQQYGLKEFSIVIHLIDRVTGKFIGSGVGSARAEVDDLLTAKRGKDDKVVWDKKANKPVREINQSRIGWANNKALKIAKKRAIVDAAKSAGSLSGYFTQDLPDDNSGPSKPGTTKTKTKNPPQEPPQESEPPAELEPPESEPGENGIKDPATPDQLKIIETRVLESHLLAPFEYFYLITEMKHGINKKSASIIIDKWLNTERPVRKELEAKGKKYLDNYYEGKYKKWMEAYGELIDPYHKWIATEYPKIVSERNAKKKSAKGKTKKRGRK